MRFLLSFIFISLFTFSAYAQQPQQLPIHILYINHVEVESVIDYIPPLTNFTTYMSTTDKFNFTKAQLEWEIAQAESARASISFHMSGAFAERAIYAGDSSLWDQHIIAGHTVGFHSHLFMPGFNPFQWVYIIQPNQYQKEVHWQNNYAILGDLVGSEELWVGESHYDCPTCWTSLGYTVKSTEKIALLPAGQHIVWQVERDPQNIINYPHLPQIGEAGWHGPQGDRTFFDLRLPQLKKEFLMLYLEWLERERLSLEPQVWAWGWANHGGSSTIQFASEIQEMLSWLNNNFAGKNSPRGNIIARFINDHEIKTIYENYESSGGQPLPSPIDNINDQFSYLADALTDAGVTADLSDDLALSGIKLFEMEIDPPEEPLPDPLPRSYLLFRETDGSDIIDISSVLASRGIFVTDMILTDVKTGVITYTNSHNIFLDSKPLVLTPSASNQTDIDNDGLLNNLDNCPSTPNGPDNGTCVRATSGVVIVSGVICSDNSTCGYGEICQMNQEDFNANSIGDACECYADCDNSSQVNVFDLIILKNEYNRNDCSLNPCNADCNDDRNVNIFDLIIMKNQYNRTGCPVIP